MCLIELLRLCVENRLQGHGSKSKGDQLCLSSNFLGEGQPIILLGFLTVSHASALLLSFPNLLFFLAFKYDVPHLKIAILNLLSLRFDHFPALLASFQSGPRSQYLRKSVRPALLDIDQMGEKDPSVSAQPAKKQIFLHT